MLETEKAVHAAAYLVEKAGGHIRRRQLCRLLYLCERTFLLLHEDSFTGDRIVATKDGPALEGCLAIFSASELSDPWSRWLEFGNEETVRSRKGTEDSSGTSVEDFDALSVADVCDSYADGTLTYDDVLAVRASVRRGFFRFIIQVVRPEDKNNAPKHCGEWIFVLDNADTRVLV